MTAARYSRALTCLGLVLAALILFQLAHSLHSDMLRPLGGDFLNVWAAPQIAQSDLTALFDLPRYMAHIHALFPARVYDHDWSYPLFDLWFFAPFAALPYGWSLAVWTALGLALYLAVLRKTLPSHVSPSMMLCFALAPLCIVNFYTGQNGLYTGALALFALLQLPKRPVLAGICIGLLTMKPQLGLLWPVLLISLHAWRAFAAAAITATALISASLYIHGFAAWEQYLHLTAAFQWALISSVNKINGEGYYTYHLMMIGILPALRLLQGAIASRPPATTRQHARHRHHQLFLLPPHRVSRATRRPARQR